MSSDREAKLSSNLQSTITVSITAAVGFAWTDGPAPRDLLVGEADHAMYRDKRARRQAA